MGNIQIYDNGTQSEHSALSALACEPRRISRLVSHFLAAWNKIGNPSGLAGYQCIGQFYSHRVTKRTARQSWHSFSFFVVSWDSQDWDPSAKFKNATSAWNTYIIMVLHTMFYGCWHKWVKNRTWRLNCAGATCDIRTVWHRRFHLTPPSTPSYTVDWPLSGRPSPRQLPHSHADGLQCMQMAKVKCSLSILLLHAWYYLCQVFTTSRIFCVCTSDAPPSLSEKQHTSTSALPLPASFLSTASEKYRQLQ